MSLNGMSDLDAVFDRLYPLARSITGPAIRESMEILGEFMPLEIHSVPSGTRIFDWVVPNEWKLNRATLHGPDGKVVLDSADSNLHVINFSIPYKGELHLEDLRSFLHSIPDLPDAIPYVTSYYKKRWGLCLPHSQLEALKPGIYRVNIDTELVEGHLNYAICDLPGDSDEIIQFSSYLCHPSMANNELSGPLTLLRLYEALSARSSRRFTYRFVLAPETIGSLTYLSVHHDELKKRLLAGMVLTCLGGSSDRISIKLSRRDWIGEPSRLDLLARFMARVEPERFELRSFTPIHGSDERQFCSPGANLPVVQLARTLYGLFPEYHTSLDTKELMGVQTLCESSETILDLVDAFEVADLVPKPLIAVGEPNLGQRNLYPTINTRNTMTHSTDSKQDYRQSLNLILEVFSLVDGIASIVDMAFRLNRPIRTIIEVLELLQTRGVVELRGSEKK